MDGGVSEQHRWVSDISDEVPTFQPDTFTHNQCNHILKNSSPKCTLLVGFTQPINGQKTQDVFKMSFKSSQSHTTQIEAE